MVSFSVSDGMLNVSDSDSSRSVVEIPHRKITSVQSSPKIRKSSNSSQKQATKRPIGPAHRSDPNKAFKSSISVTQSHHKDGTSSSKYNRSNPVKLVGKKSPATVNRQPAHAPKQIHVPSPTGKSSPTPTPRNLPMSQQAVREKKVPLIHDLVQEELRKQISLAVEDLRYYTATCLKRARLASGKPRLDEQFIHETSPFLNMQPVQNAKPMRIHEDNITDGRSNKSFKTSRDFPVVRFKCTAPKVPAYRYILPASRNFLSENERAFHYEPSVENPDLRIEPDSDDDTSIQELFSTQNLDELAVIRKRLSTRYVFADKVDTRKDLDRKQVVRFLKSYMETAFDTLGCSAEDIVHFLLQKEDPLLHDFVDADVAEDVRRAIETRMFIGQLKIPRKLAEAAQDSKPKKKRGRPSKNPREPPPPPQKTVEPTYHQVFDPSSERSKAVLASLPSSTERRVAMAGLVCYAWWELSGDPAIWSFVQSSADSRLMSEERKSMTDKEEQELLRSIACRICQVHNCENHGEIRDHEVEDTVLKSSWTGVQGDEGFDADDSWAYNTKTAFNGMARASVPHGEENKKILTSLESLHNRPKSYIAVWRSKESNTWKTEERWPFIPCNHPSESCEDARCSCYQSKIQCEKTCCCPSNCDRRTRGCDCSRKGARVCYQDNRCACFRLNHECDPDLCHSCGAAEVLDPKNRYDSVEGKCWNVGIQKGLPKKTFMGKSSIAGFGLYVGEPVKRYEHIGEYTGEALSNGEMERREAYYKLTLTQYGFSLNAGQAIDATKAGNKFRYINNAEEESNTNVFAHVMIVNGMTRIGFYATRNIEAGEELFFNYNMHKLEDDGWIEPATGKKRAKKAKTNRLSTMHAPAESDMTFEEKTELEDLKAQNAGRKDALSRNIEVMDLDDMTALQITEVIDVDSSDDEDYVADTASADDEQEEVDVSAESGGSMPKKSIGTRRGGGRRLTKGR